MPKLAVTPLLLAVSFVAACSGTASVTADQPAQTAVAVAVNPPSAEVEVAGTVRFAAVVTGTAVTTVDWAVVEGGGGTIDATGRYVAPATAGTFHVRAASVADPTVTATATVTVSPPAPVVVVTVAPTAAADACRTLTLTAAVSGTTNQAVTWSVLETDGGTITPAGVYTAPSTAGIYHAVATSQADPTRSASVAITVTERILSVQVSPPNVTVPTSGTTQLTATVTTTCGAFASTAQLTAQGRVVAQ